MSDCLHLAVVQQQLAGFESATHAFISNLDPMMRISYNPNLDSILAQPRLW